MEHAQTCPSPPDVTQSLMTQQPASPPDVYSIAVMTKSSSKVLGSFPTIKSFTGRSCYRKANSKTVWVYARQKFPGFDRGSRCSYITNQRITWCGCRNLLQRGIANEDTKCNNAPDVYSIAVMTKSSSKVLGSFPTIKSFTGRWLSYRKANSKTVQLKARQKFPGFDRGSGYSYCYKLIQKYHPYVIKEQAFWGGACVCHEHFGGGACVCHEHFGGRAYSCHNANTLWLVSRVAAQRCPNKSTPDVYSVAVIA